MENQIAAKIYPQLNDEGHEIFQFKGIIDHKKYGYDFTKETGFTVLKGVNKKCNTRTHVLKVLVEWRYKTTTWMDFKDTK